MGMLLAADLSQRLGYLTAADVTRIRDLLRRAGLPLVAPPIGAARALELMGMDKKVLAGRIRLVLLDRLGSGIVTGDYPAAALQETLRLISRWQRHERTRRSHERQRRRHDPGALCTALGRLARQARGRTAAASSHRVPARPRPHRPFHRVSPPRVQDPGLRQSRGRPLPHAPHALARGGADRPQRRARAQPQRAARRGHLPRARPRPHAVRPRRPGRAQRLHARLRRLRAQPAVAAGRRRARGAVRRIPAA